jgi:ABC-type transport system substrate-binding protein
MVAFVAVLALSASCTGGGEEGRPSGGPTTTRWHGGTLRIADLVGPGFMDPAKNWAGWGTAAELFRCCLARTLISYVGRGAEDGGSEPRPDLAAEIPEVSADGLTWTFRLREGLRYGPPLQDVEIVAQDIVRALERTADPATKGVVYASYFSMIEGYDAMRSGGATSISGLVVPDPHTLVVRLVRPAGDLIYRFSLPNTSPIPEGVAEGHRNLSAFLVSTGPYMLEGSEEMDFSLPPDEQVGAEGYALVGGSEGGEIERITLVRNPSWDPRTDPLRPAYVDRIEIENHGEELRQAIATAGSFTEAYNDFYYDLQEENAREIDQGTIDVSLSTIPSAEQVRRYRADPHLRDRLIEGTLDRLYYSAFNLAVPPFDDVHVRRAVSLALDRARVADLINADPDWLGARVANHIAPDGSEDFLLQSYRPSWSTTDGSDPDAARAQMRLSPYDTDGDGRCDATACRGVVLLVEETEEQLHPWSSLIGDALRVVGIVPDVEVTGYGRIVGAIMTPGGDWGTYLCIYCNWVAEDYPSASSVFVSLLYGPSITESGNQNVSLLGATPGQLEDWGYTVDEVPSADDRIDACQRLVGSAQIPCWAELDQYLMEEVVPWIPLFFEETAFPVSERVAKWSFDQQTGYPALDQIALVPGSE